MCGETNAIFPSLPFLNGLEAGTDALILTDGSYSEVLQVRTYWNG